MKVKKSRISLVAFWVLAASGALYPSAVNAVLSPVLAETGKIAFSIDGVGTNSASGIIDVDKPSGATVRVAVFACATTGFTGTMPADGAVTLAGVPVSWGQNIPNGIQSFNTFADVTTIVKPLIDAAPAGNVPMTVAELNPSFWDGCALAVVFDDPAQPTDSSVTIVFGAQATSGDSFAITLAQPLDLTNVASKADMGLAITFSFQGGGPPTHLCGTDVGQDSQIDVNASRLSSCAGNFDDAAESGTNGNLFTVGGLSDGNDNPADALQRAADGQVPRVVDDELYDLKPFVMTGDTLISVATINPSADDNIFLAYFRTSVPSIVGEGIVLAPGNAQNPVGTNHTVTATIVDDNGAPITGRQVDFEIVSGPHAGLTGSDTSDVNGEATFTYAGTATGQDVIVARFVDSQAQTQTSNSVTKLWVDCGDNLVNQTSEQCDGTADTACPGLCRPAGDPQECTCASTTVCGDNLVNQPSEECDGTADDACPGLCTTNCTCAPQPVCGDNAINQPGEECDGTADAQCPGLCRPAGGTDECTCIDPTCGDNLVNQTSEQCDGTDDGACPGRCQIDCTCGPAQFCGDNVVNLPGEVCDGTDDASCPGRCIAAGATGECTCSLCGNGMIDGAESCDDGNTVEGCRPDQPQKPLDACKNDCTEAICKDPSRIYFGRELDRIRIHGRIELTAPRLPAPADANLQLRISSPAIAGGVVFETSLAPVGMPSGTIEGTATRYRYADRGARRTGGMSSVLIRKRGGFSYAVTIDAYGDLSNATSPMTTHIMLGGHEWTVTAPWFRTTNGWRSAH